jgi:hypothetical protein
MVLPQSTTVEEERRSCDDEKRSVPISVGIGQGRGPQIAPVFQLARRNWYQEVNLDIHFN